MKFSKLLLAITISFLMSCKKEFTVRINEKEQAEKSLKEWSALNSAFADSVLKANPSIPLVKDIKLEFSNSKEALDFIKNLNQSNSYTTAVTDAPIPAKGLKSIASIKVPQISESNVDIEPLYPGQPEWLPFGIVVRHYMARPISLRQVSNTWGTFNVGLLYDLKIGISDRNELPRFAPYSNEPSNVAVTFSGTGVTVVAGGNLQNFVKADGNTSGKIAGGLQGTVVNPNLTISFFIILQGNYTYNIPTDINSPILVQTTLGAKAL